MGVNKPFSFLNLVKNVATKIASIVANITLGYNNGISALGTTIVGVLAAFSDPFIAGVSSSCNIWYY